MQPDQYKDGVNGGVYMHEEPFPYLAGWFGEGIGNPEQLQLWYLIRPVGPSPADSRMVVAVWNTERNTWVEWMEYYLDGLDENITIYNAPSSGNPAAAQILAKLKALYEEREEYWNNWRYNSSIQHIGPWKHRELRGERHKWEFFGCLQYPESPTGLVYDIYVNNETQYVMYFKVTDYLNIYTVHLDWDPMMQTAVGMLVLNTVIQAQERKELERQLLEERKEMNKEEGKTVEETTILKPQTKALKLVETFRMWPDRGIHLYVKSPVFENYFKKNFLTPVEVPPGSMGYTVVQNGQILTPVKAYPNVHRRMANNRQGGYVFNTNLSGFFTADGAINLSWLTLVGIEDGLEIVFPGPVDVSQPAEFAETVVRSLKEIYLKFMKPWEFECTISVVTKGV